MGAGGDQLRDHRVVAEADLVAFRDAGLDAHRIREPQPLEPSRLRQERARILRVQAHLDRGPAGARLDLEPLAACDSQLPLHEVDAPHLLGHRVLDLDATVQLEEEELAALEHELGRARADVADRACEARRRLRHLHAQVGVERGRRRLLEHLLVAALHRALALAEREHRPMPVGEQLDLDVTRALEVALEIDAVVAEPACASRRAAASASSSSSSERTIRIPRPPPPAAALTISGGSPASGTVGTPASAAIRFASSLSPPRRSASAGGPTQASPAASTAAAKSAFSDRKP